MVTIYLLLDPRDNSIRYVGKTARTLDTRLKEHLLDKTNSYKANWIRKIKCPVILSVCKINENWEEIEKELIAYYLSIGCKLTNTSLGGEGGSIKGRKMPEDFGRKISEALKGRKLNSIHVENMRRGLVGLKKSEEHCLKIGNIHRGKVLSAETKEKIGSQRRGSPNTNIIKSTFTCHSENTKLIISEKSKKQSRVPRPVIQADLQGNIIEEWTSCSSARKNFGDTVLQACQLKIYSCYGYQWRYKDSLSEHPFYSL